MRLTTESGDELDVTSRADLERALVGLGREGNGFAVLKKSEDAFMQVAATAPGAYAVEYHDGSREPLFRSEREDLSISDVLRLFTAYLERDEAFRDAVAWTGAPPPTRAEALSLEPGPRGERTARRMVALVIVGFGLAVLALGLARRDRAFHARAIRTTGVVASVEVTRSGRRSSAHYWPVLRFETPDGRPHTFRGDVGSTSPEYRVGQRLVVLYDPRDPGEARMAGPVPFSNGTVLAGVTGPLLAIIGTGALLLRQGRWRRWR